MQAAFPGLDSTPLSTVPLMMHLTAITQRLPLRVLQVSEVDLAGRAGQAADLSGFCPASGSNW